MKRDNYKTADVGLRGWEKKLKTNFAYRPEFRQFNRKNNDKVLAMYEIYLSTGKSLEYIAKHFYRGQFTRQSLYDVFRVRGYKLRSKQLRPARIYKGIAYRLGKGGYRSRIKGELRYLHKVIWEEKNGPIPLDHYIVFRDGNKENITSENMICLSAQEAKKMYNYANQFGYKRFKDKGEFGGLLSKRRLP